MSGGTKRGGEVRGAQGCVRRGEKGRREGRRGVSEGGDRGAQGYIRRGKKGDRKGQIVEVC